MRSRLYAVYFTLGLMALALLLVPLLGASIAVSAFPSRRRVFWVACFFSIGLGQLVMFWAHDAADLPYVAILTLGLPWLTVVALLYLIPYPRSRFLFSVLMPFVWATASVGFEMYGLMIGVLHE